MKRIEYEGQNISVWLNEMLDEAGILQADLARMIGTTYKTVSLWNTGTAFPAPSNAKLIVLSLAHIVNVDDKQQWQKEKLSVYNSIRQEYVKVRYR